MIQVRRFGIFTDTSRAYVDWIHALPARRKWLSILRESCTCMGYIQDILERSKAALFYIHLTRG